MKFSRYYHLENHVNSLKALIIYWPRQVSKTTLLKNYLSTCSQKYRYDTGIRNGIIANFNPLNQRNDVGELWENFIIMERIKKQAYTQMITNNYFWRTWDQQEIDLIEEREGNLFAYEIKWSKKSHRSL